MSTPLPLHEALDRLLDGAQPLTRVVSAPLADLDGRVLGDDVTAPTRIPAFDNSAMDGYALRHLDAVQSPTLPVTDRITPGHGPALLAPGCAARIFTGAALPDGADTVVRQEDCEAAADSVTIQRLPEAGANVRPAGQEARAGALLLRTGRRLNPADIGLLAAAGIASARVREPLRVAVLSSGDELMPAGQPLRAGQVHDANGPLLVALLRRWGLAPTLVDPVGDDPADLRTLLVQVAGAHHVVLATGGMSVGEEDHLRTVVAALGAIDAWRIAIKPGKPIAWGRIGETPFLGLPGNPGAALVTAAIVARPWLLAVQGADRTEPVGSIVPAGFDARADRRTVFRHGRVEGGRIVPFANPSSALLSGAAWGDGLAEQAPGTEIRIGDPVRFLPWGALY